MAPGMPTYLIWEFSCRWLRNPVGWGVMGIMHVLVDGPAAAGIVFPSGRLAGTRRPDGSWHWLDTRQRGTTGVPPGANSQIP